MPTINARITNAISELPESPKCFDTVHEVKIYPTLCVQCFEIQAISEWLKRTPEERFDVLREWKQTCETFTPRTNIPGKQVFQKLPSIDEKSVLITTNLSSATIKESTGSGEIDHVRESHSLKALGTGTIDSARTSNEDGEAELTDCN